MLSHKKIIAAVASAALSMTLSAVVSAADADGSYTGYVLYTGNVIADVNGISQQIEGAVVVKMDGTTETVATIYDKTIFNNQVVTVAPSAFGVTLSYPVSDQNVSGKVNASSMSIGNRKVSENVKILDTAVSPFSANRPYVVIDLERIDGVYLNSSNIQFCKIDENGNISELILNNVTNDAYNYGVAQYNDVLKQYIILGAGRKWRSLNYFTFKPAKGEPTRFLPYITYDIDMDTNTGKLISYDGAYSVFNYAIALKSYGAASEITADTAIINNIPYKLSDNVQIFFQENYLSVQTSLESVSNGQYLLNCYYDKPESKGGRIRIIIAKHKQ